MYMYIFGCHHRYQQNTSPHQYTANVYKCSQLHVHMYMYMLSERTCMYMYLVGLHEDEDVVDADGQHQEGNDLDDDERQRHAEVAVDANGADDRKHDDDDARQTEAHLRVEQQRRHRLVLTQRQADVDEHDEVAERDGDDVRATLAVQLVLDRALKQTNHE